MDSQALDRVFTHNEIYVNSPDQFNDPFDSRPYLVKGTKNEADNLIERLIESKKLLAANRSERRQAKKSGRRILNSDEQLRTYWGSHIKNCGVLSFAEDPDDLLMWAHYGQEHKGICLGFDYQATPFNEALPVKYRNNYPQIDLFKTDQLKIGNEVLHNAFLVKSKHWKYEKEYRIVRTGNEQEPQRGIQKFIPTALKSVVLGMRITGASIEKIRKWRQQSESNPAVYQATADKRRFSITLRQIEL